MTKEWPSRPEEPSKGPEEIAFEEQVLEEMRRLREIPKSPSGKIAFYSTEELLRKAAEKNIRSKMETEKRDRELKEKLEQEKRRIALEGLTEEELEEIARKRAGKR